MYLLEPINLGANDPREVTGAVTNPKVLVFWWPSRTSEYTAFRAVQREELV